MLALTLSPTHAYVASFQPPRASRVRHADCSMDGGFVSRRETAALAALAALGCRPAWAADYAYQPALQGKDYGKTEMGGGPDFTKTPSGLSYKDAKVGKGKLNPPKRCQVRVRARIGACACACGDAGFLECAETGSCRWTPWSQPSAPATPTPATST